MQPINALVLGGGTVRWKYDVVLALGVIQRLYHEHTRRLALMLQSLEMQELYIHLDNRPSWELMDFAKHIGNMDRIRALGVIDDKTVYKLWRVT